MNTLLSQITPQRSTQYSQLASELAIPEWKLSPLQDKIVDAMPAVVAGQEYLRVELSQPLSDPQVRELGYFAMTSAHFELFEELGGETGPFLRPMETGFESRFPHELVTARRYRGKTNELLTQFMCNIARFSSGYANQAWSDLRVFDPLSGGGTTLFTALTLGAEVAGVEHNAQDVSSTAAYMRQFCKEQHIRFNEKPERLRKLGKRWTFTLGDEPARRCVIAQGETQRSDELLAGFKPQLIVTDMPYGIQHRGKLAALVESALPVWMKLLPRKGCLVFSWDATRFSRDDMAELVEASGCARVLHDGPYALLSHRVDRVIKERDILVVLPE